MMAANLQHGQSTDETFHYDQQANKITSTSDLVAAQVHEGCLLFQGTLAELQAKQQTQLTVGVKQLDQAIEYLERAGWTVQRRADRLLSVSARSSEDAVHVNSLLVDHRLDVFHLALAQASLEDIFLTLTRGQIAETRAA